MPQRVVRVLVYKVVQEIAREIVIPRAGMPALMVVLVTAPAVVVALAREVQPYVLFSLTSCTQATLGAT